MVELMIETDAAAGSSYLKVQSYAITYPIDVNVRRQATNILILVGGYTSRHPTVDVTSTSRSKVLPILTSFLFTFSI
jgi:hypothetical protein